MDEDSVPFEKTVFVCTHSRTDGRASCANPGRAGDAICQALKVEVKNRGLKNKIRIARSGCLDLCAKGPNVFLYPENVWVSGLTEDDIPKLIERITSGN